MTPPHHRPETAALTYEMAALAQGFRCVAGMDEAGRGPWAGPVAAAVVALPLHLPDLSERLKGARDSKQMTARQRARLREPILNVALGWGVGMASATEIDQLGIMGALKLAFGRALAAAAPACQPDYLLLDYVRWPECPLPSQAIRHGDSLSLSIACASILAKTARDEWMEQISAQHPHYGFERHKGYGTDAHAAAIERHGVIPGVHRTSFEPVRARWNGSPGTAP